MDGEISQQSAVNWTLVDFSVCSAIQNTQNQI